MGFRQGERFQAPPNGRQQVRMPVLPEDTRQFIHIRAIWRATCEPLQPADEACTRAAVLDTPQRPGDVLDHGRTVMISPSLLNGELLLKTLGAGCSAELPK